MDGLHLEIRHNAWYWAARVFGLLQLHRLAPRTFWQLAGRSFYVNGKRWRGR